MKKDIIKNRIIHAQDFIDKKFKPSLQAKLHFIKLFELFFPEFNKHFLIKTLDWNKNSFNLDIIDKESNDIFKLNLKDNLWYKNCSWKLCTNNICNWVHYEIKNKNFLKFLVYFSVKWKIFTIDSFLNILTNDYKAKKEFYQIFWKQNRPPFSIIQDWGHSLHKFRFIVHEWVFRNMDQSIRLNLPEASIHHSERECQWITPWNKATWYHFFNFPWEYYDHSFDKYYYLSENEKKKYLEWDNSWRWISISTDLDENDIVMWEWTDKLTRALDYVIENIQKNNIKILNFNCCCVPRVIWDDVYSVLKRAKEKSSIPFLFQWQLEKTPYEQKVMLLEEYIDLIESNNIKKIKNSISLFWYHENKFQKMLWDILKENWVRINTSFIPTIDIRLLELMFKSELFVFSTNNFQKEVFEYPFQNLWFKSISPCFPYWFKNSENWLKTILWEFNIEFKYTDDYKKVENEYYNKVKTIENKWYKVWIVLLWLQEVKKFLSTDYMNNIDIIWFLKEMWFKLDFIIFDNFEWYINNNDDDSYTVFDWNHEMIEELVFSKVDKDNIINISYFWFEDEFSELFIKNKYDLIYSDIYFDNRIAKLWINQFNLKNFHVWNLWALETITELLNLCEMSYYKNYSVYFKD